MRKCIFCGKTDVDFNKKNCFTEEHIIPEALGNQTLKVFNVCKKCNSGLGSYVDNYFVNSSAIKLVRNRMGIKGKSGKLPIPFREGIDKYGHRVRIDANLEPRTIPHIEQNGNKIQIFASSKEEAKTMIQKKFSRMKLSKKAIQGALDKLDQAKIRSSKPKIYLTIGVELTRFLLEPLKIAFEYAVIKLGDQYLKDLRAVEIQKYLQDAIDGKMTKGCPEFPGVFPMPKNLSKALKIAKNLNCHMVMIHPDDDNNLFAEVILFMESTFSFTVYLSDDASKFFDSNNLMDQSIYDLVEIKTSATKLL